MKRFFARIAAAAAVVLGAAGIRMFAVKRQGKV